MLYSREPRSSVCPSRRTRAVGYFTRYWACAATTGTYSERISLLSKSKNTTFFCWIAASACCCGVSAVAVLVPAPVAPSPPRPLVAAPESAGGAALSSGLVGFEQAASPRDRTATANTCINFMLDHSWIRWGFRLKARKTFRLFNHNRVAPFTLQW